MVLQWSFHPFIYHSKRFYTVLLWRRVLAFLVVSMVVLTLNFHNYIHVPTSDTFLLQASQFLRIITFYSTQLPGPNYHCREVTLTLNLIVAKSYICSILSLARALHEGLTESIYFAFIGLKTGHSSTTQKCS